MIRSLAAAAVLLLAGFATAEPMQTALTPSNVLYAIAPDGDLPMLELTLKSGTVMSRVLVPGTEDSAVESHPRLVWDDTDKQLFVVWHRSGEEGDEIRLATLSARGEWSAPVTVAGCSDAKRTGLQVALGHAASTFEGEPATTLVHIAWWKIALDSQTPEYALLAFENGKHVSTEVENLIDLAAVRGSSSETDAEDIVDVLHPPMAMARTANAGEVEIAFGAQYSTAMTRVKLQPRKIGSHVRIWKPGRIGGSLLPRAGLTSATGAPVRSFIANGRIVLYTPDEQFRYVVYDNGAWTPTRMIKLDAQLSGDALVEYLRRAVDDQESSTEDDGAANE